MNLRTLPQVAREVGVEYRTLHSWVQRGLLTPTYPANGTGHQAHLTDADVLHADALARLRRAGCGIGLLEEAAFLMKQHNYVRHARVTVFDGDGVKIIVEVGADG